MTMDNKEEARIKEIRRENFDRLFEKFKASIREQWPNEPERGMLKRFSEHLGMSKAFLSHIKTGVKPIGDRAAMKIEDALSLARGWMDVLHDDEPTAAQGLTPMQQQLVALFIELLQSGTEDSAAELIAMVREKVASGKKAKH
ncbi:hypothetical protein WT88_29470 [Burkholderia stagnalis]|nr:hypothetical protein WT35_04410 [Burkholderia stagnalis]KWN32837.1 hypothetical protein WT86_18535 [Burkholderia stagnalis]KWN44664.1 hypothetical protein WT88_29470 [Burkholderia stagnalis]KWN54397.1 hypothetical protein WT87_03565 [Burkholderia stagnalis]KWO68804.1 hypothetical protein WT99_20935 [Burkholderia stagnalis]